MSVELLILPRIAIPESPLTCPQVESSVRRYFAIIDKFSTVSRAAQKWDIPYCLGEIQKTLTEAQSQGLPINTEILQRYSDDTQRFEELVQEYNAEKEEKERQRRASYPNYPYNSAEGVSVQDVVESELNLEINGYGGSNNHGLDIANIVDNVLTAYKEVDEIGDLTLPTAQKLFVTDLGLRVADHCRVDGENKISTSVRRKLAMFYGFIDNPDELNKDSFLVRDQEIATLINMELYFGLDKQQILLDYQNPEWYQAVKSMSPNPPEPRFYMFSSLVKATTIIRKLADSRDKPVGEEISRNVGLTTLLQRLHAHTGIAVVADEQERLDFIRSGRSIPLLGQINNLRLKTTEGIYQNSSLVIPGSETNIQGWSMSDFLRPKQSSQT